MRALILAAGRGTRISRYLSGNPKCTVDIGGTSLIRYTVKLLNDNGITDIAMALGYRQYVIREELKDYNVQYFYNPFYDVTNSIASSWFTRDFLAADDDVIIMNGDVYIEPALITDILNCKKSPVLFSDETRKEEADYKFYYENEILIKYGKELTGDDITGEYVGIAKIGREFMPLFNRKLFELIDTQQHSVWWENVLYEIATETNVFVQDVGGKFWAEVDYIEDYERILKHRGYKVEIDLKVQYLYRKEKNL